MEKTAYPIKEFFSKGGHLASPWDNLSIREKAEMMKVAVRNGITNLSDIKQKYNEFAEGGEIESPVENSNIYAGGSYLDIAKQHIKKNEDWLAKPYRDAPKGKNWRSVGYGFNDSGFRSKYPQGISKHYENGITEAQAEEELNWFLGGVVNHLKKVYGRKWDSFNDNQKAAVIDTYYQRPASVVGKGSQFYRAVMAGDKNAGNYLGVAGYGNRNKDRRKLFGASQIESVAPTQEVLPISEPIQSMPEDTVDFIPWNPQAFFGVNNNTPIIIHQEAPVVEEKIPTPEEIERQERQQGLANFQTIMGLLNNTSNSTSTTMTPFESTVSMLTQQSPIHYFSDGGSIHIKSENRGKFTALKERTGHSASWFKDNGTPAQKKMATFALNARKWKHGLGGNLFDIGGPKGNNPRIVTTGGAGYVPSNYGQGSIDYIRRALYDNITPFGYHNPVQRVFNAVADKQDNSRAGENVLINSGDAQASALDAIWGTYLGIPANQRRKINSKYNISKVPGGYYKFNDPNLVLNFDSDLSPQGLYSQRGHKAQQMNGILGNYTVGLGRDSKGDYIYYSDSRLNKDSSPDLKTGWDINPYSNTVDDATEETTESRGQYGQDKKSLSYKVGKALFGNISDLSMGIGKPVPIYDRIYLDDYYKVPGPYRGGVYLPEVTVYGKRRKKKALGGNLFEDGGIKAGIPVVYPEQGHIYEYLNSHPNESVVLNEQTVVGHAPNARQRLAKYLQEAPARDIDKVMAGYLAAGIAPIAIQAAAPGVLAASDAIGGSTAGQVANKVLTNPYFTKGLESAFAGHGLNHVVNEDIDGYGDAAMTTLELTPLGGLAKPMMNAGRNSLGLLKDNAKAFYNNLTMDLNSVPGSFYHGSPSRTIEEFIPGKDGGIYFTPTKRAARGYTGNFGTGRVYEANLNLGDNPVVVDARGKAWNSIPEEEAAKAFGIPKEEIYKQIGHYNAGAEPWYSDFLKPFGYNPNTRSYAVDQLVTLGKDLGKSSLTIKGAKDSGKGLFGWRQLPYDQTIVYRPEQISLLKDSHPIKSTPQITAERAASITPKQWTALQDAAIAKGNMAEAQRLRDLHFKVKSNTVVQNNNLPLKTYHTINESYPTGFTEFDPTIEGTHSAIYTSDSPIMSGTYARSLISNEEKEYYIQRGIDNLKYLVENNLAKGDDLIKARNALKSTESAREYVLSKTPWLNTRIVPERQKQLYVKLNNPLMIEGHGKNWNDIPIHELPKKVYDNLRASNMNGYTTRDIERAQKLAGYDGGIIKNITDYGSTRKSAMIERKPSTVYQINEPNQLKLADAVTYDDNGIRIPLGDRDNFNINDIRYSWLLPLGVGVTGYGVTNK